MPEAHREQVKLSKTVAVMDGLEARRLMSVGGGLSAGVSPAIAEVVWRGQTVDVREGRYVAQTKPGADFYAVAERQGFSNIRNLGGGAFAFDSEKSVKQLERLSRNLPKALLGLSPSFVVQRATVPNDQFVPDQWSYNNTGQLDVNASVVPTPAFGDTPQTGTVDADIDLFEAWAISTGVPATGQAPVIAAVLDTGIDPTHPDLKNKIFINTAESDNDGIDNDLDGIIDNEPDNDGIDDDGNGIADDVGGYDFTINAGANVLTDRNGHGSHTAGVIAAQANNTVGISGVSQGAMILPVKVLTDFFGGTDEDILAGINYVVDFSLNTAPVTVMNLSLGGVSTSLNPSYFFAFQRASAADIVVTIAAGNDSFNNDGRPFTTPARFSEFNTSVITVAATDNRDGFASFSNFGKRTVQVGAPGVNILSTVPINLIDPVTQEQLTNTDPDGNNDGYTVYSGTSEAAPTVAGIAAILKAYRPTASALQIKQAILDGVDVIPSLAGNGVDREQRVSTSGRVNALKALRQLVNNVVEVADRATAGNWIRPDGSQVYGEDGRFLAGQPLSTLPGYASISFNASSITATADRVSPKSEQVAPLLGITGDFSSRSNAFLTAADAAASTFTLDLNLSGDTTRRVSFYFGNLNGRKSTQTLTITDSVSGTVIDSRAISDLRSGVYATYDLTGNVTVRVSGSGKDQPVLNAIYFDEAPAFSNTFVGTDTFTKGTWRETYGILGHRSFGISSDLPSGITLTPGAGATEQVVRANVPNVRGNNASALEDLSIAAGRGTQAYLTAPGVLDLTVTVTGNQTRQMSVYLADVDNAKRVQRVELIDFATGNVLDSRIVGDFRGGIYLNYNVSASVVVRATRISGGAPVIGGVYFDEPALQSGATTQVSFIDDVTRGNWRSQYGFTDAVIPGVSTNQTIDELGVFDITAGGAGALSVVSRSTRDLTALQDPNSATNRISSLVIARDAMTLQLPYADEDFRTVSLYFADVRGRRDEPRVQRIEIVNRGSGLVEAEYIVRDFAQGKYVSFLVKGGVDIRLTRVSGPSVVYSGLFID